MDNNKEDCDNNEEFQSGEIIKLFSIKKQLREKKQRMGNIYREQFSRQSVSTKFEVLCTFASNKCYAGPRNLVFFETYNTEFDDVKIT